MPDEMTQSILGALTKMDTKLDGVKDTLDNLKDQSARLSERIANIEVWKAGSQREEDRWWSQTWPNHEAVIAALDERLRMAEQSKATQEKIDELEKRLREVESVKSIAEKVKANEAAIASLREFDAGIKVKLALIMSISSVVGAGAVTAILKLVFHF